MKHIIKRMLAQLLQFLIRQPWLRKLGQRITQHTPELKRRLLRLLYNTPRQPLPDTVSHQGDQEARLQAAIAQRLQEYRS